MRTIFSRATTQAARVSISLVVASLLWVFASGQAAAGFCSSTSCNLRLINSNFIGTGTFGTVNLTLSANVVTIDVNLASALRITKTGFPGAVGFADNVGGGLTIGDFKSGGVPTPPYSGHQSSAPGCAGNSCNGGGFAYANAAAAMSGPQRPLSLQKLSFTITKGTSITDVHQLLRQYTLNGQNAKPYSVANNCVWLPVSRACRSTGLLTVTQVPEPASLAILASGLFLLAWLRWKRVV
jgi:PEP-CTERM motif